MIVGVACTILLGVLALWKARQVEHWKLVARMLGHDHAVERAKRQALAMALGDLEAGLRGNDPKLCARAVHASIRIAKDDTDETLRKLGFVLPERPC